MCQKLRRKEGKGGKRGEKGGKGGKKGGNGEICGDFEKLSGKRVFVIRIEGQNIQKGHLCRYSFIQKLHTVAISYCFHVWPIFKGYKSIWQPFALAVRLAPTSLSLQKKTY